MSYRFTTWSVRRGDIYFEDAREGDPTYNGAWEGERYVRTRLFSDNYVYANKNSAETYGTWGFFDYSTGWMNRQGLTGYTDWMSWMWKRGQGMEVVT